MHSCSLFATDMVGFRLDCSFIVSCQALVTRFPERLFASCRRSCRPRDTLMLTQRGVPVSRSKNVEHIGTNTRLREPKHSYLPRQWTEGLKKGVGQSCIARKINDTEALYIQRTRKSCSTRAAHSKRCSSKRSRSALKTRTSAFPVLVSALGSLEHVGLTVHQLQLSVAAEFQIRTDYDPKIILFCVNALFICESIFTIVLPFSLP
jgi:hypothetical protein